MPGRLPAVAALICLFFLIGGCAVARKLGLAGDGAHAAEGAAPPGDGPSPPAGDGAAPAEPARPPGPDPASGAPRPHNARATLTVITGERVLGAYAVRVKFDPAVLRLTGVTGDTSVFPCYPITSPGTFASGDVVVTGFQTDASGPRGRVAVADLHFVSTAAAEPPLKVELTSVCDPFGEIIPARATAEWREP